MTRTTTATKRAPGKAAEGLPGGAGSGSSIAIDGVSGVVSGVALYVQLASLLRHRIASGQWPVGYRMPSVEQMANEFGVARVTVRQAFAMLVQENLVTSLRGRGTHVCGVPVKLDQGLHSAINDMRVGHSDFQIRVQEKSRVTKLPIGLAERGLALDRYVRLRKLHLHDGVPFCLIDLYVAASVFSKFPKGSESRFKIGHLLREVKDCHLGVLLQTMTVEPADFMVAKELGCSFSSPIAKIRRVTLDDADQIIYTGWFWYRGDRFILDMELPANLTERYPAIAVPDSLAT